MDNTNLDLPIALAESYSSLSQKARVTTESWVVTNISCPNCLGDLQPYASNTKGKDVYCVVCGENFQIKSKKGKFSNKITGAEYQTTRNVFSSEEKPSLMLLHYDLATMKVINLAIIHKSSINVMCIIPRKPLAITARRAGWQGCIIDLSIIPTSAIIKVVENANIISMAVVQEKWRAVNSL